MFEFLKGTWTIANDEEGEIIGYNKETNKFILKSEEDEEIEFNIFNETGVNFQINHYENWEKKLFETLESKGKEIILVKSTESYDDWLVEIHKSKSFIIPEVGEKIELVSYVISFCGDVKGKVLTVQNGLESEFEKFQKWINEQLEEVAELNDNDEWNTCRALIIADSFNTVEEQQALSDMWEEMHIYSN